MRSQAFTLLSEAIVAVGVLAPSILCARTDLHSNAAASSALVVTETGYGVTKGEEYVQADGTLILKSDQSGVTAVEVAVNSDFPDSLAYIGSVKLDLTEATDSIGIRLQDGVSLSLYGSAHIQAATAIQGDATVYLDSEANYDIVGGLEMKAGTIENDFGAHMRYVGLGEVGSFKALSGSLTVGAADAHAGETFLRIGSLEMASGSIVNVIGDRTQADGEIADNRVLLVEELKSSLTDEGDGLRSLNLTAEATLVLGTELASGEELSEVRREVYKLVNSSKVVTGSLSRATLITSDAVELEEGFSIVVGEKVSEQNAGQSGIHIGSDGRWIVYFEAADKKQIGIDPISLPEVAGATDTVVTAEGDAELILYNWNGQAFYVGDFAEENVHSFGGVRLQIKDGVATRLWCKDFAGLKASSIVGRVEMSDNADALKLLPGYRFIIDTFDEELVGRDAYANVIDGAVFLPITSGVATAGERVFHDTVGTIMRHDLSLYEGKGHWWVEANTGRTDADKIFSGGSGDFGFEADVTAGTLGYDFSLGEKWIVGAAVSFAGIDTQSKGNIESTTADMSMAAISLAAARHFENYSLRLALIYARAAGDVEQRSVGHRLETDVDMDFLSLAARLTSRSLTQSMLLEPFVGMSVNGARLHDGTITDSAPNGTVYGKAFNTSAKDRLWATFEAGADLGCGFEFSGGYSVKPSFGASVGRPTGKFAARFLMTAARAKPRTTRLSALQHASAQALKWPVPDSTKSTPGSSAAASKP